MTSKINGIEQRNDGTYKVYDLKVPYSIYLTEEELERLADMIEEWKLNKENQ